MEERYIFIRFLIGNSEFKFGQIFYPTFLGFEMIGLEGIESSDALVVFNG